MVSTASFPALLDQFAQRLSEPESLALLSQIQQVSVSMQGQGVRSSCVQAGRFLSDRSPIVLLHGFDSSLLEFRRLVPRLAPHRETWAIDLLGFGFSDRSAQIPISPQTINEHLYGFWQQHLQERSLVLVGASMGGAAALKFALTYPQAVKQLVLIDSAGVQMGPVIGKFLFPPLDRWAVEFLRRPDVRRGISRNAYANPDRWVTPDAEACAALHLEMPNWAEALKSFTKSGGYPSFRSQLTQIHVPTLILWGRNDRILGTQDAIVFEQLLPQAQLQWIEDCGHVPHLEQPEDTARSILTMV
jgi:pimeloyl-ACP methyl ester carboxylesterase